MSAPSLNSIETPAVLVDYTKLRANIECAQKTARENKVALRPHIKTHKCLQIARMQIEAGAVGVTASKAEEALTFIEGGVKSVTVAYPQIEPNKAKRLLEGAKRTGADLRLTVDSIEGIQVAREVCEQLQCSVGVFLEIDVGLHRCGLKETDPCLLQFAEAIQHAKVLKFRGLLSHAGHAYGAKDIAEVQSIAQEECAILQRVHTRLVAAGHVVSEVSVGATPTFLVSNSYDGITEVRPGNYVFLDMAPVRLGLALPARISLTVITSVVSVNDEYCIIDAGSKVLSSDLGAHGTGSPGGYGTAYAVGDCDSNVNGLRVAKLSEEHGFVKHEGRQLAVGTRLCVIPNHACPVVNLAERLVVVREREVSSWPVDARAKVH